MTTLQISTDSLGLTNVLSAAVSGFVAGLGFAFIAMVAVPAISIPVFLFGWLTTGAGALRIAQLRASGAYWGEDFGGIRDVRAWHC